jgi:hypothetical protein
MYFLQVGKYQHDLCMSMKKIFSVIMALVTGAASISMLGLSIHGAEAALTSN